MVQPTFKRSPMAVAVSLAVAGGLSHQAQAQDDEIKLEEVTVTAQKREETLLETPISITTLDNFQLEQIDARSLDDLNGYVPALFTAPFAADSAAPVVFIRGQGNVDVQTTKDNAVGIYLDGVVLGRATGLALDVADLERIEVLRGPQGTLYGRNTTGGAINYVTSKPHEEFGAKVRLTGGNYGRLGTQIDLNLPATDNLFFRLGYLRDKMDGWVENENVSGRSDQADPNEHDNEAFRAALRWQPTDNFTLDYAFDYSDLEYGNGYYQVTQADPGPGLAGGILNASTAKPSSDREDEGMFSKGFSPSFVKTKGHNLTLTWDLSAVTLKSITGYRELDGDLFQNYLDGLAYFPVVDKPAYNPASEFVQMNAVNQEQFSQEFQAIGSAFGDSFQYVAGLYYFKEKSEESQVSNFGVPDVFDVLEAWDVDSEAESKAIYGQGTWRPNALGQRLGITLGLRYTEDDRKADKNYYRDDVNRLGFEMKSGKNDFSNTSGTFIVDYMFTDNINSYVKYATGYRSGGFSTRATRDAFEDGFDPEDVQSFELGLKSMLWDQRISLNAAAYYNEYDDLQVAAFVPLTFNNTINAGDTTIKGAEIELVARVSRGWTIDGFYAYTHAEYGEYLLPDNDGGVKDWSDVKKVPNAPKNQAKLGAEFAFPMTGIGQITARLDYLYVDEFWSNPDSQNRNDGYGIWNGRVQWLAIPLPAGDIRVALWGKNLADEEYTVLTTDFSGGDSTVDLIPTHTSASQFGMPRTYGLDVIYEY